MDSMTIQKSTSPSVALLIAHQLMASRMPGGFSQDDGGVVSLRTGVPIPPLNGVAIVDPSLSVQRLEETITPFAEGTLPWSIRIPGAAAVPAALEVARALQLRASRMQTLVLPMADASGCFDDNDERIRPIRSSDAAEFAATLGAAFEMPASLGEPFVGAEMLTYAPARLYVGINDGRVVATGMSLLNDGWLGVFSIGVAPEARRHGLGRGVTRRILHDGITAGAHTAYLQASDAARPLYEHLGFRDSGDDTLYFQA